MIILVIRAISVLLITSWLEAAASPCEYPAKPINWIMRYCAMSVGSDDETLIQSSQCFKDAQKDSQAADPCRMNEKYKTAMCHDFLMESKKYPSIKDCLNDDEIVPYVSG